jgi:CBS domain containing-hemolysin-like protein
MKNINLLALEHEAHLVHPEEFNEITLHSPALTIFTDFKKHMPLEIEADTPAIQVQYLMRKTHVHMQLVVDDNDELIGLINSSDLDDQKLLILQNKGIDRGQILVKDLMLPRAEIKVLDFKQLISATIADIVGALKQKGAQHCLVVDSEHKQIRGLISASDIARRLHIPLKIELPTTFVDIFVAVNDK